MKLLLLSLVAFSALTANDNAVAGEHCRILHPGRMDENMHICEGGRFGVLYNNVLASKTCYSSLLKAEKAMNALTVCQKSPRIGNCKLLQPNVRDKNNQSCSGISHGVTYKGYLADKRCYDSVEDAVRAMESNSACTKSHKSGNFAILYPDTLDRNGRYCDGISFGIKYKSTMVDGGCYNSIEKAISVMENLSI